MAGVRDARGTVAAMEEKMEDKADDRTQHVRPQAFLDNGCALQNLNPICHFKFHSGGNGKEEFSGCECRLWRQDSRWQAQACRSGSGRASLTRSSGAGHVGCSIPQEVKSIGFGVPSEMLR